MNELLDPNALAIVGLLAIIANLLIDSVARPVFEKFDWDTFWLMYVAWAVSGVLVWLSGANVFLAVFPSGLVGQIITALLAGRGSNLIHDLTNKPKPMIVNHFEEGDPYG